MKSQAEFSKSIIKNFNIAAENYESSAFIQSKVASLLVKACKHRSIEKGLWLDLGSGTGLLAKKLEDSFPRNKVIRIDASSNMLNQQPDDSKKILHDLNLGLPKLDRKPNLIASSFALHWLEKPEIRVKEWLSSLTKGGWLALAYPIHGSFHEWQKAAHKANVSFTAIDFPKVELIEQNFKKHSIKSNESYRFETEGDSLASLLKPISTIGAQATKKNKLSIGEFRRLEKTWLEFRGNKPLKLTWLVQVVLIKK